MKVRGTDCRPRTRSETAAVIGLGVILSRQDEPEWFIAKRKIATNQSTCCF